MVSIHNHARAVAFSCNDEYDDAPTATLFFLFSFLRGIECASSQYPAVGIRTSFSKEDFIRSTTCEIAVDPAEYFGCTPPPSSSSSQSPSAQPSSLPSSLPSSNEPSNHPTFECIPKPNRCDIGDVCCGTAVCQGGFCRTMPTTNTSKEPLKVARQSFGGIRGSIGYTSIPEQP
jgi:hypothetical protein